MRTRLLLSALLSTIAWAQLTGPTPGYVFDAAARELRPMRGMAGSAHLGSALIKEADAASVSLDGTMAISSRLGAIELIRGFDTATPVVTALAQEPGPVAFAWSGHDVAAVFAASRKALLWRGADPAVTVDLSSIDGAVAAVVFDGERLVLAAKGGVFSASAAGASRIAELADPSALLLSGGTLFAADRTHGRLVMIRDYATRPLVEDFASVASPVGMQLSRRRLLVASAESRSVEVFDVQSKARLGGLDLEFAPTRMEPLGNAPLAFLNTGSPDEPLFVLDSTDTLQVYFVPAGREQ